MTVWAVRRFKTESTDPEIQLRRFVIMSDLSTSVSNCSSTPQNVEIHHLTIPLMHQACPAALMVPAVRPETCKFLPTGHNCCQPRSAGLLNHPAALQYRLHPFNIDFCYRGSAAAAVCVVSGDLSAVRPTNLYNRGTVRPEALQR